MVDVPVNQTKPNQIDLFDPEIGTELVLTLRMR